MPSQACREILRSIILRRTAGAYGKRRTAEWCGNRFSTRSRSLRWERWRWRLQIRTLFTWERASIRFFRTAATEMEFTSPLTVGRTGSTSGWRILDISGGSWSIRAIRISSWWRRWDTVRSRTKSAEIFGRRMAGGTDEEKSDRGQADRRPLVHERELRGPEERRHCLCAVPEPVPFE